MARSKTSPKTEKAPKPPRARRAAPSRRKKPPDGDQAPPPPGTRTPRQRDRLRRREDGCFPTAATTAV